MIQRVFVFAGIGLEIGFLIFAAQLVGEKLDETYHSKGLIFVCLAFLLLIGWLAQVIWLVRRFQKQEESNSAPR